MQFNGQCVLLSKRDILGSKTRFSNDSFRDDLLMVRRKYLNQ